MNTELFDALEVIEKEKNISRESILEAIKASLVQAVRNQYNRPELNNIEFDLNPETKEFEMFAGKTVTEEVEDSLTQISLADARMIDGSYQIGDIVRVGIESKNFGRIVTQNAKNVILQKIREEERKSLFNEYYEKSQQVLTGIVQRYVGNNVSVNLGKVDAILNEKEMIHTRSRNANGHDVVSVESFYPTQRIKVYVLEVRELTKGPRILLSRTHPDFVRRLFENEVTEVKDKTVEIKAIAREAGSRTKIAVFSNDPDVDPVGACVGMNGSRVSAVVDELGGEKIDVINWDENPALLIENALSPAKVIYVACDPDDRTAQVVVPDNQLSLAIGKEGQNARLAARLTGFKIDIKSETQARDAGELLEYESDYYDEYDEYDEYGEYEEDGEYLQDDEYADEEYASEDYGDDVNPDDGSYETEEQ